MQFTQSYAQANATNPAVPGGKTVDPPLLVISKRTLGYRNSINRVYQIPLGVFNSKPLVVFNPKQLTVETNIIVPVAHALDARHGNISIPILAAKSRKDKMSHVPFYWP